MREYLQMLLVLNYFELDLLRRFVSKTISKTYEIRSVLTDSRCFGARWLSFANASETFFFLTSYKFKFVVILQHFYLEKSRNNVHSLFFDC